MNYHEKFDLVVSAIAREKGKTSIFDAAGQYAANSLLDWETTITRYQAVDIDFVNNKTLNGLSRHEILETLNNIALESKTIKPDNKRNYSKWEMVTHPGKIPIVKTEPPNDVWQPIRLFILPGFDNWYEAYKLKKNRKLEDFSEQHIQGIYKIVKYIDDKLQLDPHARIIIPIPMHGLIKTAAEAALEEYTDKILDFLRFKGAINFRKDYFQGTSFESFVVSVNIKNFYNFKREVDTVYNRIANKQTKKKLSKTKPKTLKVTFDDVTCEILVDGRAISKPDFNTVNYKFMEYIIKNPNKTISLEEIKNNVEGFKNRSLHKPVQQLKFTGKHKAFFTTSKNSIRFNNPLKSA